MSAIKSISGALGYDACEAALAAGAPLSTAFALAVASLSTAPIYTDESGPASVASTVWGSLESMRETVRPSKWSL